MVYLTLFPLVSLITAAHALNDWTKPCTSGVCSYDIPDTSGSSGSLKIWGDNTAISDITTAAGWEILGCSPGKLSQDIRIVCKSDNADTAGCSHLFKGGAEGTIVRLPQACGQNAFARVAKLWVPQDQTIPTDIARRIVRRDGTQPQVNALTIDTDFGAIDASKAGTIQFALKAANIKGAAGPIDTITVGTRRRSSRIYNAERGLFDFVADALDSIKGLNNFDLEKSKTDIPLHVDATVNLVNTVIQCPPITASLRVAVHAQANGTANIGVAATGTIIPPKFDDFAVITSLSVDIDSSVHFIAGLTGSLDSGPISIFQAGVPGLSFPGILTIGPRFEVNLQAIARLDVQVDLTVGIKYKIANAEIIFPPSSEKAQAANLTFTAGDTPIKLSVSPSVKATGSLEAHIIPSLNLGVVAIGNHVKTGIVMELDALAFMQLSLEAHKGVDITVPPTSDEPILKGRYWAIDPAAAPHARRNPVPGALVPAVSSSAARHASNYIEAASTKAACTEASSTRAASTLNSAAIPAATSPAQNGTVVSVSDVSFGGCFDIGAGFDINVGADAGFFKIFKKTTRINLFRRRLEIFRRCIGDVVPPIKPPRTTHALTCPGPAVRPPVPLVISQVVPAASVKSV